MKNFLILSLILISAPVFATCSIEGDGACSVAELMQQPMQRTFYRNKTMVKEFSGAPEVRLKPSINDAGLNQSRNFGPSPTNYSYNTSCLFGVCNSLGAPQLFPNGDYGGKQQEKSEF